MHFTDFIILGIILGGFLLFFLNKRLINLKSKKILATAKKTEKEAISFLESEGYKVTGLKKKKKITIYIDGKPYNKNINADILVEKNRKKYIVELKTGKNRATHEYVRRQLLEYYLVYNPDRILLLDMEKRKIKHIEFQWVKPTFSLKGMLISGGLGGLLGLLLWYLTTN